MIVTLAAGAWCSLSSGRPAQADTDVATFLLDYTAETSQGRAVATIRSTVVLAKLCSNWRIVHEHYSPLVAKR